MDRKALIFFAAIWPFVAQTMVAGCGITSAPADRSAAMRIPLPVAMASSRGAFSLHLIVDDDETRPRIINDVVSDSQGDALIATKPLKLSAGSHTVEVMVLVSPADSAPVRLFRTGPVSVVIRKGEQQAVEFTPATYRYDDDDMDLHSNYYEFTLGTAMNDARDFPPPQNVRVEAQVENVILQWDNQDPWAEGRSAVSYDVYVASLSTVNANDGTFNRQTADRVVQHVSSPYISEQALMPDQTYCFKVAARVTAMAGVPQPRPENELEVVSPEVRVQPLAAPPPVTRIGHFGADRFDDPAVVLAE